MCSAFIKFRTHQPTNSKIFIILYLPKIVITPIYFSIVNFQSTNIHLILPMLLPRSTNSFSRQTLSTQLLILLNVSFLLARIYSLMFTSIGEDIWRVSHVYVITIYFVFHMYCVFIVQFSLPHKTRIEFSEAVITVQKLQKILRGKHVRSTQ